MDIKNEVINFIETFLGGQYATVHDRQLLQQKFEKGYCYYFAKMLETAFNRGKVCWVAPLYHFVWQDVDGQCYDVNGLFNAKQQHVYYFVPETFAQPILSEYKHVCSTSGASKQQMVKIIKQYCMESGQTYIDSVQDYL